MTSLYVGSTAADDMASPLLDTTWEKNKNDTNNFHYDDDPEGQRTMSPTPFSSEAFDIELSSVGYDDPKTCCCCPQLLKSMVAVLIAMGGATASALCFVFVPVDPLSSSIWVYIMAGLCLINSLIIIKNEKTFLFTLPTSRREVIELLKAKKSLEAEMNSLAVEVEVFERNAARYDEAKRKLQGITSNVDEFVQLVQENEETLELIRENLCQKVLMDVVRIILSDHGSTHVIDCVEAQSLASKIKVKMEDHGVVFDEEKFLHALAANSTTWGAIRTIKKLVPKKQDTAEKVLGKGEDIFDMFYLPNNDQRQIGSVHAARAMLDGTHISLSTRIRRTSKQHEDWNDSSLDDNAIPKRHRNRLREQLYQFRMMSFPFFRESKQGRCLFGTLIILTLANSGISVYFSYLIRDFWTALEEKNVETFYHVMYKFLLSMIVLIPLQVGYRFIRVKLGISWRKFLTERVLMLYFSNKVYYGLERQSKAAGASVREYGDRQKEMDNPDQRIQEDVDSFTSFSLMFFLTVINTVIDLISFSIILYTIMPGLFIAIILFASIGTLCTVLIGKVLIKLNYESLQREADFRFSLVRIRENAESIAFYGGEKQEEKATKGKFIRVVENMTQMNVANLRLDMFTATYNHIVNILPIFVLAHDYFIGQIEFGVIAQSREAFWHILNDLSIIINSFQGIAAFMAGIDRLFLFMKAIQKLDSDRPNEDATVIVIVKESVPSEYTDGIVLKEYDSDAPNSPIVTLRNLRVTTPDHKRILFENINLSLVKGQNLLIAGVSGAGKSSLLRAIAGLWRNGDGEVVRSKDVYFLPQRPYCPQGTLREQLLYPSAELADDEYVSSSAQARSWSDEDLLNILASVDLPDLASRAGDGDPIRGINATLDWSNTLSLGEQQRLAFGRLLVNRPRLVVMDESTSALDVVAEKRMYTLLKEGLLSDTGDPATYVSVGHRPTLLAYHDLKLLLRDGVGYASFIPHEDTTGETDQESILRSQQR